jgi:hypothetical protein
MLGTHAAVLLDATVSFFKGGAFASSGALAYAREQRLVGNIGRLAEAARARGTERPVTRQSSY